MSRESQVGAKKRRKAVKKDIQAKGASRRGKTAKADRKRAAASRKRSKISSGGFLSGRRSVKKTKAKTTVGRVSKNRTTKKGRVKVSS